MLLWEMVVLVALLRVISILVHRKSFQSGVTVSGTNTVFSSSSSRTKAINWR